MAHVISIIILLLAATGVFAEIQDSINIIWGLKTKPKKHLIKLLLNRVMSFSMIASMGFILLVSLMVSSLLELLSDRLFHAFPQVTIYVAYAINVLILFGVISVLFGTIFMILPDGKIKWRHVRMGAYFTAFLFMVGKFAIGFYLGKSHIATIYGAAGSLIIILIWVYYSSIILYFGAEFTHVYAQLHGHKIRPNDYAVSIEKIIIETEPLTNEKTIVLKKV
jgi:membrane protein